MINGFKYARNRNNNFYIIFIETTLVPATNSSLAELLLPLSNKKKTNTYFLMIFGSGSSTADQDYGHHLGGSDENKWFKGVALLA